MQAAKLSLSLLLLFGCAGPKGATTPGAPPTAPANVAQVAHPFGSRPMPYPPGSIGPTGDRGAIDRAVTAAYDRWKAAHVVAGCGGHLVKRAGEPGQVTSSAALGAGMIILAYLGGHDPQAQTLYDGMLTVARKFPSYLEGRAGNLSYAIVQQADGSCAWPKDKKGANTGDSSVYGDLDFAFALLLGQTQWRSGRFNYAEEARRTIATIRQYDINPISHVPLIGDWASLPNEPEEWKTSGKTSNFMFGHFRAFASAETPSFWHTTIEKLHTLTASTIEKYSPTAGLLPLYLRYGTIPPAAKMLSTQNAGHFVEEAGSIPFRLAADYVASGDPRSKATVAKMLTWMKSATGGDPTKIVNGYRLDGAPLGKQATARFIAPFGSAAIIDADHQTWLDATWKLMTTTAPSSEEDETITLINMILMSGNWWQPGSTAR